MQPSAKETIKIVVVCLIVMLALPAAYRIWLIYHPQPERLRQSLTLCIEKAAEDNALRLLKTPLPKWTEWEQKAEPKIYAWLKAHEKTVLPWEWTDEARRKDPDGYRKLWIKLFKEQESELKTRLKTEQKKLKALEREIQIAETIHTHRTNQLARIQSYVATNTFPMTIQVERLEKGRFWGWNRKYEHVQVSQRPECGDIDWVEEERRRSKREAVEQINRSISRRIATEKVTACNNQLLCVDMAFRTLDKAGHIDSEDCQRVVCVLIKNKEIHDEE